MRDPGHPRGVLPPSAAWSPAAGHPRGSPRPGTGRAGGCRILPGLLHDHDHVAASPARCSAPRWSRTQIRLRRSRMTNAMAPVWRRFSARASSLTPVAGSATRPPSDARRGLPRQRACTSGTITCSNSPSVGEIDVMEDVNALSEVAGTLHCGVDPGGPCNETTGQGSGLVSCSGCQTGFNTYSVIVNRTNTSNESITLLLNGTVYHHGHREPDRHVGLAGRGGPRFLPHPGRRHRRRLPERRLQLRAPSPPPVPARL